jgi:mycothiol synthase
MSTPSEDIHSVPHHPSIEELRFRRFRGSEDFPHMFAVIQASKHVDQDEWNNSLEDITRNYNHLKNCDPSEDMIFAEIAGRVVGYGRVWWEDERKGTRLYPLLVHLMPQWRGKGIRQAMLEYLRQRAAHISQQKFHNGAQYIQANAGEAEIDWIQLLKHNGFGPVRWEYEMVRPLDEDLPVHPIPEGFDVRPVRELEIERIWSAAAEAFADHWGETDWFTPATLAEWQESPRFLPELWQVAWHGDEVAGMVLNEMSEEENKEYDRKRGYTETISVRQPWRGRGLAKALISRSLQMWQDKGMLEACHGVDAENEQGALQLYESLGYKANRTFTTYRKPLCAESGKVPT